MLGRRGRLTLLLLGDGGGGLGRRPCGKMVHSVLAHFVRLDCGRTDNRTKVHRRRRRPTSLYFHVCPKTSSFLLGLVRLVRLVRNPNPIGGAYLGRRSGGAVSKLNRRTDTTRWRNVEQSEADFQVIDGRTESLARWVDWEERCRRLLLESRARAQWSYYGSPY